MRCVRSSAPGRSKSWRRGEDETADRRGAQEARGSVECVVAGIRQIDLCGNGSRMQMSSGAMRRQRRLREARGSVGKMAADERI